MQMNRVAPPAHHNPRAGLRVGGAHLVDAGVGLGLLLGGGVQTPQGGEATLALAGGARGRLRPPPHTTLAPRRHLVETGG